MKKYTSLLMLGAILMGLLAACAAPAPEVVEVTRVVTEKEEVEVEVPVEVTKIVEQEVKVEVPVEVEVEVPAKTLVFSSRLFSPPREQEFFIDEVIKPFEEEHGVTVNFQILDDDTLLERAKIQQDTNHVTTDIVCAHNGKMPDWLDAGYVMDLTPYVESWTDRHFSPAFESDTNRGGKQYFLPVGADVYLLLANNNALPYLPAGADLMRLPGNNTRNGPSTSPRARARVRSASPAFR
jgi:multiple sugar transport system substrate-binding protein